jgi:hypothetical protein
LEYKKIYLSLYKQNKHINNMKNLTLNQKQVIAFAVLFIGLATTLTVMAMHGVIHFDLY